MADEYPLVSKWTTIFLYPFPFPPGPENKGSLNKTLQHAADRWKPYTLSPEKNLDELSYFFPYIQDFLCAQVDHFQFKETEKAVLEVSGYDDVAPKLTAARLHLFPLGIGILSLRIEGKTLVSFSRLLDFNSDFRYLTKAYKKHSLPQKIVLTIGAERLPRAVQDQSGIPPLLNDFLWEIGGVPKSQLLDNRMIVYSYAALKRDSLPQDCDLDDVFFKFLFVDKTSEPLPDAAFRRELLHKHEYRRWQSYTHGDSPQHQSVRYGFSRYSGVVMGLESGIGTVEEKDFFKDRIFEHFTTMYYDIALILLFHRTALIRLSDDLTRVDTETIDLAERRDKVRQLRVHVLRFTNRYWFGEITNQDQGIEMFDCWKNALRNKDLFEEVHAELQEYDNELRSSDAERLNRIVTVIAVFTLLVLPLSFTASFLAIPDSARESFGSYAFSFYVLFLFAGIVWISGRPLLKTVKTLWARFKASLPQAPG